MKPKKLHWALASIALSLGLLLPGLAAANPVPETCGRFTCVRAILDSLRLSCRTDAERRPRCIAIAVVGAAATWQNPPDQDFPIYSADVFFVGLAYGGPVDRIPIDPKPVPGAPVSLRPPTYTYGGRQFRPDGTTITKKLAAPEGVGRVRGCLDYSATFVVRASAGPTENVVRIRGPVPPPDSASTHRHSIRTRTLYCAPL